MRKKNSFLTKVKNSIRDLNDYTDIGLDAKEVAAISHTWSRPITTSSRATSRFILATLAWIIN